VRGCTRVSDGCGGPKHQGGCYAEKIAARFSDPGQPFHGFAERTPHGGRWTGRLALVEDKLLEPLSWKKPRRIFVNSMSDLFHENLPDEAIDRVFAVMALCPQHTFQVLTKRAARMRAWFEERWQPAPAHTLPGGLVVPAERHGETRRTQVARACEPILEDFGLADTERDDLWTEDGSGKAMQWSWPLPNVWLGVSAEDQKTADERIPDLLATPAAIRFVSAEPLLGPIIFSLIPFQQGGNAPKRHIGQITKAELRGLIEGEPSDFTPCGNALGGIVERSQGWNTLDWIIVGGESGPRSRPMHPAWARQIRDQCAAAGVAFFFKQWGEHLGGEGHDHGDGVWFEAASGEAESRWIRTDDTFDWFEADQEGPEGPMHLRVGKKTAGRLLDGREHNDFPGARP